MKKTLLLLSTIAVLMSCNGNKKMDAKSGTAATDSTAMGKKNSVATNIATALSLEKSFSDHKPDEMMKYIADDAVDYGDGSSDPVKGAQGIKTQLQSIFTAFPDMKASNEMAYGEGDHVAVVADYSGTFKGEMMGMKPTGKNMKYKDVDLFTFNKDGKVTEHRSIYPVGAMMQQSGEPMKKK